MMPHSITPEAGTPPAGTEETMTDATVQNGDSQASNDHDITMAEPQALANARSTEDDASKKEVKLEDLFADVESDEEFPSSRPQENKLSSSPETPSSPMQVHVLFPQAHNYQCRTLLLT